MMLNRNKNYLDFAEIFDYFFKSWVYGFRIIFNYLNKNCREEFTKLGIEIPHSTQQMDNIILKYDENLKLYLLQSFNEIGVDVSRGINFELFNKWITKDHTLEITYYNKTFKIAMSLVCLEGIEILMDGNPISV
jgi:hypothetical protein